jgi:hypothetical protein
MSYALLPHYADPAAPLPERRLAQAVQARLEACRDGLPAVIDDEAVYLQLAEAMA